MKKRSSFNIRDHLDENTDNAFQNAFNKIRKDIKVKNSRKIHIDSLLKKSKGHFCRAVHDAILICLYLPVKRLPQSFATNIRIDTNLTQLDKTMYEIYREYHILPPFEELKRKKLFREDKEDIYWEIINSTYEELFKKYINSERYLADFYQIKRRDGKKSAVLFDFVSRNLCFYFKYSKGNLRKITINNPRRIMFLVHNENRIFKYLHRETRWRSRLNLI